MVKEIFQQNIFEREKSLNLLYEKWPHINNTYIELRVGLNEYDYIRS